MQPHEKNTITLFLSLILLCSCSKKASEVSKTPDETEGISVSENQSSTTPTEDASDTAESKVPTTPAEDIHETEKTTASDKEVPKINNPDHGSESASVSITDSAYISAEDIKKLVDLSIQIGKYLNVEAPAYDFESSVQYNGSEYYPVIDKKFDTWDEWEAYIRSSYADNLAEEFLAYDGMVSIDGKTYCKGGGRGYDLTDEYTVRILSDEPEKVTVHVKNPSVWNDEDPVPVFEEKDYVLVKLDGGWKIEDIIF